MTDSFKPHKKVGDTANAFREGWQAACNLHLRNPQGPVFHDAWLDSDTYARMSSEKKEQDRYRKIRDEKGHGMADLERKAIISVDGKYRYWLSRRWRFDSADDDMALFVMLNPSTADAEIDDPTIRRCMGFADSWDADGIVVVNLYALRATNPNDLWRADDPVGRLNNTWLLEMAQRYETVVCAWGANAKIDRVAEFRELMAKFDVSLWSLGETKSGAPRHPLYLPRDAELQLWPSADHDGHDHG